MKLSATSIGCFKTCPMKFYLRYVLGLVPVEEQDSFRVGTNYHRIQEIISMKPGGQCECVDKSPHATHDCPLCASNGTLPGDLMDSVIRFLNKRYAVPPIGKTVEEWEVERTILLYTLVGYKWWYNDEGYEVESLEKQFNIQLLSPVSGHPLRADLVGKIDRMFSAGTNRFVHEYKSTSKNLDPDSTYWNHLILDTQTRLYTYAAERLGLGTCGVLYDVWHKPQIRPKKLTQAESKKFVEDHMYCGEAFTVSPGMGVVDFITVNGKLTETEPGAKEGTFAVYETPEMFGARLLQDISQRPEFYFARRELAHNSSDINDFQWELFNLYTSIRMMTNKDTWWRNETACEATYKCDYIDFCYNHVVLGPDDIPDNFRKNEV